MSDVADGGGPDVGAGGANDGAGVDGDEAVTGYGAQLLQGVADLLSGGAVEQLAGVVDAKAAALAALGGTFARDVDRNSELSARLREDLARLRADHEATTATPGDSWAIGNLLVSTGNVYIVTDSWVARTSCGRDFVWALPQLAEMGAAALMQRDGQKMRDALDAEWSVLQSAEFASQAIEALFSVQIPAGITRHELHASELAAMRQELEQAFGLLDTPIPETGHDESARAAEWLQLPTEGLAAGGGDDATGDGSGSAWRATHRIGADGTGAWESPAGGDPVATLDPGLEVMVDQSDGDWSHIVCDNGWSAWVDGRRLDPQT